MERAAFLLTILVASVLLAMVPVSGMATSGAGF
jgi:hypothetical protein